jgi:hypothetical protein
MKIASMLLVALLMGLAAAIWTSDALGAAAARVVSGGGKV